MPALDDYFHYRTIDVSTLKELCKRWYHDAIRPGPQKVTAHRGARRHPRERRRADLLPREPLSHGGRGCGVGFPVGRQKRKQSFTVRWAVLAPVPRPNNAIPVIRKTGPHGAFFV